MLGLPSLPHGGAQAHQDDASSEPPLLRCCFVALTGAAAEKLLNLAFAGAWFYSQTLMGFLPLSGSCLHKERHAQYFGPCSGLLFLQEGGKLKLHKS